MIPLGTGWENFNVKTGGFKPKWIIIHHSFSADGIVRNWDAIRTYHMSYRHNGDIITQGEYNFFLAKGTGGLELPWSDIGYNLGIENVNGSLEVLPGRDIGAVGAHAVGFNNKSVGICVIGNYDNDPLGEDRRSLLTHVCRQLQVEFGIPRDQVIGHRETYGKPGAPPLPAQKTCPGSMIDLDAFRKLLRD